MFDYTKTAIDVTVKDLKRIFFFFNGFVQLLYIAYLTYACIAHKGFFAANVVLLSVSVAYFVFFVLTYTKKERKLKKLARRTYSLAKIGINAFSIGVAVYGICVTVDEVSTVSVILLVLMIIGWLLSVLLQAAIYFIDSRARLIIEAFRADKETVLKPVVAVKNTVKKLVGKEVETPEEPNRFRRFLDRKIEKKKEETEQNQLVHK